MRLAYGAFLAVALYSVVLTTTGCTAPVQGTSSTETTDQEPPVFVAPVEVSLPVRGDIASYFETTSRIEAQNRVEVLSKGSGLCVTVNAEVGDTVSAGQVLVELEREEFEAQVRQARISVEQHRTSYQIAERSFEEGIGASAERDNTRFAYEQARANLDIALLKLENQTVKAPIGGIITQRIVQEGMVVSPAMPLFTIVDPDSYTLPISVPEKELARLSLEQKAEARIDAFPDHVFAVHVERINPSIDPLTGTVRIMLGFDPEEKSLLRDAAFARVRLVMEVRSKVLLVPRDAILEEEGRKYVFYLNAVDTSTVNLDRFSGLNERDLYTAHRAEVRTGLEQSDVVEVREGLEQDALVVVLGQHTLRPDAYVMVTNLDQEMAERESMTVEEALAAAREYNDLQIHTEESSGGGGVDLQL